MASKYKASNENSKGEVRDVQNLWQLSDIQKPRTGAQQIAGDPTKRTAYAWA